MTTCPTCNGTGKVVQLAVSPQAISALAKATPNEPVATREVLCPNCHGAGVELRQP
jgi:DnaJ-class molecular chaperone